jgi:DNA-binding NarL/FixJ family response regulator
LTKEGSGAGTGGASPPEKLVRILLVDDNEPWRHWVRSMLTNHAGLLIVCEVSDGIEAVQKAKELQPDLILLDIGLPRLNGIEAAGQIRQVSADSDILFLSQNHDADIVQAALSTSARVYVLKVRAARELAAAIEAVLRGERFIGRGLEGGELLAEPNAQATNHIDEHHAVTPTTPSSTRMVTTRFSSTLTMRFWRSDSLHSSRTPSEPVMRPLYLPRNRTRTVFVPDCRHEAWM